MKINHVNESAGNSIEASQLLNLYRSPAGLIHLLRGVGIVRSEIASVRRIPSGVTYCNLRSDNREYGGEQNAPVSPDKDEITHVRSGHIRLRRRQ